MVRENHGSVVELNARHCSTVAAVEITFQQILTGASFVPSAAGYDDFTSHHLNVLTLGQ